MNKKIKSSKLPWLSINEFVGLEIFGKWDYNDVSDDDFAMFEARTRQNLIEIESNKVLFFGNGTIAKDKTNPDTSSTDGTDGVSLPVGEGETPPISEFINNNGILENNPYYSIDGEIQKEWTKVLWEFGQMHLKYAQMWFIDAQASGWKPHYETKQQFSVNNGPVSSSASSFEYVDEFDQLPKQTRMHLRAVSLTRLLLDPEFDIRVNDAEYLRIQEMFNDLILLRNPEYYNTWDVKNVDEFDKKVYAEIIKINEAITFIENFKLDEETIKKDDEQRLTAINFKNLLLNTTAKDGVGAINEVSGKLETLTGVFEEYVSQDVSGLLILDTAEVLNLENGQEASVEITESSNSFSNGIITIEDNLNILIGNENVVNATFGFNINAISEQKDTTIALDIYEDDVLVLFEAGDTHTFTSNELQKNSYFAKTKVLTLLANKIYYANYVRISGVDGTNTDIRPAQISISGSINSNQFKEIDEKKVDKDYIVDGIQHSIQYIPSSYGYGFTLGVWDTNSPDGETAGYKIKIKPDEMPEIITTTNNGGTGSATPIPTEAKHMVNKQYVDEAVGGGSNGFFGDGTNTNTQTSAGYSKQEIYEIISQYHDITFTIDEVLLQHETDVDLNDGIAIITATPDKLIVSPKLQVLASDGTEIYNQPYTTTITLENLVPDTYTIKTMNGVEVMETQGFMIIEFGAEMFIQPIDNGDGTITFTNNTGQTIYPTTYFGQTTITQETPFKGTNYMVMEIANDVWSLDGILEIDGNLENKNFKGIEISEGQENYSQIILLPSETLMLIKDFTGIPIAGIATGKLVNIQNHKMYYSLTPAELPTRKKGVKNEIFKTRNKNNRK